MKPTPNSIKVRQSDLARPGKQRGSVCGVFLVGVKCPKLSRIAVHLNKVTLYKLRTRTSSSRVTAAENKMMYWRVSLLDLLLWLDSEDLLGHIGALDLSGDSLDNDTADLVWVSIGSWATILKVTLALDGNGTVDADG